VTNSAASSDEEVHPRSDLSVMTVVEHLDELRKRLIRCILYIAFGFAVALFVTKDILRLMKLPAGSITFQALTLEEPVVVFVKVAFYTGLAVASPLILWEISRFVAPGLTKNERRVLTPIVVGSPVLFVTGVLFAYFLLLPPMLRFFQSFGQGVTPIVQRLDFYVSLVSTILLYMGLCFQLPIIIFALSFTGLITSKHLVAIWKYALVVIAMVSAVVTPDPTAFSMLIVMAALSTLYFLSILLLKMFGR
jgi:sec-independent protein translocase protein TatC